MKRINFKRGLALLLSGAMAFSASFSTVFAETTETSAPALIEEVGAESVQVTICGNHPVHDEACGYVEAKEGVDGVPCGHTCEQCAPIVPVLECDCTLKCTAADVENGQSAVVKADCPVCGAENADLTACTGETPAFYGTETLEVGDNTITQALDFTAADAPTSCVGGRINHTHAVGEEKCFTWVDKKLTLNRLQLKTLGIITTNAATAMKLPDGAMVEMNGDNEITNTFSGSKQSYGIDGGKALTFTGDGTLKVTGGDGTNASVGIYAVSISVCGTSTLNAAGNSGGTSSFGISANSISVYETGTLIATSGSCTSHSYGISAGNGSISVKDNGTLNASSGTAKEGNSCGIFVDNLTLEGGNLTATSGAVTPTNDASYSSVGLHCKNPVTITGGTLEAKGSTRAMDQAPVTTGYFGAIITVSKSEDGSSPETEYDAGEIKNYKYFQIKKPTFLEGLDFTSDNAPTDCTAEPMKHTHTVGEKKCFTWAEKKLTLNSLILTTPAATAMTLPDGAMVEMNGDSEITSTSTDAFANSCGIECVGAVTFAGAGTVTATGGTIGIRMMDNSTLVMDGIGTLNAKSDTTGSYRYGISVAESDMVSRIQVKNGTLNATGGEGSIASYGIYGTSIQIENEGTLNATGGNSNYGSYGIYGANIFLNGGKLTASGGTISNSDPDSYPNSVGIHIYTPMKMDGGTLVVTGNTQAMNHHPAQSGYATRTITASKNVTGLPLEPAYAESKLNEYRYIKVEETNFTDGLDFTGNNPPTDCTAEPMKHTHTAGEEKCFTWADQKLTLNSLAFQTSAATAMELPDGATVEMNGKNGVLSVYDGGEHNYGIYSEGSLTFVGDGSLEVGSNVSTQSSSYGIYAHSISVEGGKIVALGGHAKGAENLLSSGIFVGDGIGTDDFFSITNGAVYAIGGAGSNESYGVFLNTGCSLNVKENGILDAGYMNAGNKSCGIYMAYGSTGSITVQDNGKLDAHIIAAVENVDSANCYGIYGNSGSIYVKDNGTLNASGGTATVLISYGIHINSLNLTGGTITASGGTIPLTGSSIGLSCNNAVTVSGGTLEATGNACAMNEAPEIASSYTDAKITVSKNVDGTNLEAYDKNEITSYRYLKVEKDSSVTPPPDPTPDPVVPSTGGGGYTPAPAQKPSITKTEGIGKEGTRFMQGKKPMTGFVEYEGKTYFADKNGYAVKSDWVLADGKWYHMNVKGEMQTGWNKISDKWYLMEKSGAMVTGWNLHNYEWYFMSNSGDMKTGWVKSGNNWYYMSGNGAMTSGKWIQTGGKWYYLRADGTMAANTKIGSYAVDSSGAWIQ